MTSPKSAMKEKMKYTGSDEDPITQFFTTDSFEIEDKDFYLNGRSCVW